MNNSYLNKWPRNLCDYNFGIFFIIYSDKKKF